jgi:hypothetical protein
MTTALTPALSVVLATPGDYEMIRRTIGFLRVQTVVDMVELVIVAPSEISLPRDELEGFFKARIAHLNFAQLGAFRDVHFYGGRMFATTRARHRHWSALGQWSFAAGTPLVPLVRLWRIVRSHPQASLSVLPILAYGLTMDGFGQFCGCLFGAGDARAKLVRYEFDRVRYIESDWDAASVSSNDTQVSAETR